jgi:hypothetical protein
MAHRTRLPTDIVLPLQRVLQEMFDLPAVLRGQKPVSALAGLVPMAGWSVTVLLNMRLTVWMQNAMRR